ncbi:RING-H2 zinc finger protein RHA4a [Capsicum annuum]|uniref:probable E3 ubiquitin-protein ligase RHA4A n=1 Tax=Capsicum annuum TaxID=4072 RepID=UPI0007BFBD94|nr:probable E3 ubiquitin-protein ligase RHA4A [Capsicum annuum]KAF3681391.1 RING-H2 zinc finger protein RHA4a [Capsicum annuum]
MGLPESPSPPHLYPQALQLKLYQAFIFSIPILFSIILFLLFYLFYLKRRASFGSNSNVAILPRSSNQAIIHGDVDMKGMLKNKLPIILFDEDSMMRDSQCCVCLGEFEIEEELHQLPSCKHIFHVECIRHWLRSNFSCPLCRRRVIITSKNPQPSQQPDSSNNPPNIIDEEREQHDTTVSREDQHVVIIEELSSASSSSSSSVDNNIERDFSNVDALVISINKAPNK